VDESVELVENLVARFPVLRGNYDAHLFNEGTILPHVFFWDLTQEVVQVFILGDDATLDWRGVLDYLEEQVKSGNKDIFEVIVTSFLWYMPYPGKPGHGLVQELGPELSRRLLEQRPNP
jgi:hypothetical protein